MNLTISGVLLVSALGSAPEERPEPMIVAYSLPAVPSKNSAAELQVKKDCSSLFYLLKENFSISHTELALWLGLKRRSSYNWLQNPESSNKNIEIERRLLALEFLKREMEPEHRPLLFKLAFSVIYGEPKFGEDILAGASHEKLILWYEELYGQFEAYRNILKRNGNA